MWFGRKMPAVAHPPLRGVNLGGWLVLEKWITPSLFGDSLAADEYDFSRSLDQARLSALEKHRDTFITKADFKWLAAAGIHAVRLPVGYWIFGGESPYRGAIKYVDMAMQWAQETGLYVLIDMHGAPGSQNGWDHSGRAGYCGWAKNDANIIKTLTVLQQLARRYKHHPRLLGFELLNEPKASLPKRVLQNYYQAAYQMLRKECGPDIWIVFHDNFRPRRWKHTLRGADYKNMAMDTHQYQVFGRRDKKRDIAAHIDRTLHHVPRILAAMRRYHPIIVGEWSIALDPKSLMYRGKKLYQQELEAAWRTYGAAQLLIYDQSSAWFYWTYKTEEGGPWSFRDCVEQGWLPRFDHRTPKNSSSTRPEI